MYKHASLQTPLPCCRCANGCCVASGQDCLTYSTRIEIAQFCTTHTSRFRFHEISLNTSRISNSTPHFLQKTQSTTSSPDSLVYHRSTNISLNQTIPQVPAFTSVNGTRNQPNIQTSLQNLAQPIPESSCGARKVQFLDVIHFNIIHHVCLFSFSNYFWATGINRMQSTDYYTLGKEWNLDLL